MGYPNACAPIRSIGTWSRLLLLLLPVILVADDPKPQLAIINAGVEQVEDGPIVPQDFSFLPGDYVHFVFQISGFTPKGDNYATSRQIALTYTVELLDQASRPIEQEPPNSINDDVSPQDKNWTPKRHAAFVLPSFLGAGTYMVKLSVHDVYGNADVAKDFPFHVGGHKIAPVSTLTIQNFRFLRNDQDGPPLEVAAYRAGTAVWARFDITGFEIAADHALHLKYGVSVLRPDGSVIFTQADAADEQMKLDYLPQFIPGVLSVTTTPTLARGEYTMVVSVHDLIGKKDQSANYKFQIE